MPLHFAAWRHALTLAGATFEFGWSLFMSRAGMSLERTVEELAAQFRQPLSALQIADAQREYMTVHHPSVSAVVEVAALARNVARTHPVSVASGSLRPHVETTLETIGLLDLFSVIVTPEDVTHGKPDPEMFLLAAERMGVSPAQCAVFEDSDLGLLAAERAGMLGVRVVPASVHDYL
jgi:beta-phosphoglucomutase-like phosphatase (HAD superfamily)